MPSNRQPPSPPRLAAAAIEAKFRQALNRHQTGRLSEAERICEEIVRIAPEHFEALHLLGIIALSTRRPQRAADLIGQSIRIHPNSAAAHNNLGNALSDLGRLDEALSAYDRAVALNGALADAHFNRGAVLRDLRRPDEALASHDRALMLAPDRADIHLSRGALLKEMNRPEQALAAYDRAIALAPDLAEAHYNRGNLLNEMKRHAEALASFDRALALHLDTADVHNNRGNALSDLKRLDEALLSYDRAIARRPDHAQAHYNRGMTLSDLKRPEAALASYDKALALNFDGDFLRGERLFAKMQLCDWRALPEDIRQIEEAVARGEPKTPPFPMLSISASPALQRKAAEVWARAKHPPDHALGPIARRPRRDRIRLGYLSANFYEHAVAYLIAELIERHDRYRFDVFGFAFGRNPGDAMQRRLGAAFDRLVDVRERSDRDVAALARSMEIDIAVDLMGYTADARAGIFAARAAPIQVNYLGYPGTTGAETVDYLIADATLIPPADRRHYSEKIACLPDTYQANDTRRPISDRAFTRAAAGLPERGFVFCCFNQVYKIAPAVFDCWMRILERIEGSVLWLLQDNGKAAANLRRHATERGIDPARLVFAPRMPLPDHLARHRLADLFLDTLPYNAHTTASDALWAGLPVLTCRGNTFAGRVGASLLQAIGLPELVAGGLQVYETMAVDLATQPAKLGEIRSKLAANRLSAPLFDSGRFARHIEAAYTTMMERYRADLPPDHFEVPK